MENYNESINLAKQWFLRQIKQIENYPSEAHRFIILISTIECFAQQSSGFSHQNMRYFVEFLHRYSAKYNDVLKELCPISIYYHYFEGKENIDLLLNPGTIYSAGSSESGLEANRLFNMLPEDEKAAVRQKHSYAGLIYQLRNKLVHEFLSLNMPINFKEGYSYQPPHMAFECSNEACSHIPGRWALHIPEDFVKKVAIDAVDCYLNECLEKKMIPFCQTSRKCYAAWYD